GVPSELEQGTVRGPLTRIAVDGPVRLWELAAGASFLGAIAGGLAMIAKKYRTFDLYPSTYCQVTMGIAVGMLTGGVVGSFAGLGYADAITHPIAPLLALATGFLTSVNIEFLAKFLRKWFADVTRTDVPESIPSDLPRVLK